MRLVRVVDRERRGARNVNRFNCGDTDVVRSTCDDGRTGVVGADHIDESAGDVGTCAGNRAAGMPSRVEDCSIDHR